MNYVEFFVDDIMLYTPSKLNNKIMRYIYDSEECKHIFINFENVSYVNSMLIGTLIRLKNIVDKECENKHLIVYNMSVVALQASNIIGLNKFINICKDKDDAINFIENNI